MAHDIDGARCKFAGAPRNLASLNGLSGDENSEAYWDEAGERLWYVIDGPTSDMIEHMYRSWKERYRQSAWCNLHERMLGLCVALAPLRLMPYVVLWIIDEIPPMNFRVYEYTGSGTSRLHDPNHLRKLRLIEGVARSYERIMAFRASGRLWP